MPKPTQPATPAPQTLPALRAAIDALDRDILQLLARRHALVGEMAQFKRSHGLPIRDLAREAQIVRERRDLAASLGLSPDLIESLYRLLLWGSRDRQAALRVEVPPDVEPKTVAIIGGQGALGRRLAELFGGLGHTILIADRDTPLTPAAAAAQADLTVVSVPIDVTDEVIRAVGPHVRPDALLADVTSVKIGPVAAMLAATQASGASVAGMHPLFGPSVHSLQGQRIVLVPGRGDAWLAWLRRMLHARGLVIVDATADDHDRMMAVVQVLAHVSLEALGGALTRLAIPLEATLEYTSPIYLIALLLTGRHFAQSADLYGLIQHHNPRTAEVFAAFEAALGELHEIAANRDLPAFRARFADVRRYFGAFTARAMEQSDFLIDRVVERG